jgi:hypothetical protein
MWLTPGDRALSGIDCASLAELRLAPAAVLQRAEQSRAEQAESHGESLPGHGKEEAQLRWFYTTYNIVLTCY